MTRWHAVVGDGLAVRQTPLIATGAFIVLGVGLWRGVLMANNEIGKLRLTFEADDYLVELEPPRDVEGFHLFASQ